MEEKSDRLLQISSDLKRDDSQKCTLYQTPVIKKKPIIEAYLRNQILDHIIELLYSFLRYNNGSVIMSESVLICRRFILKYLMSVTYFQMSVSSFQMVQQKQKTDTINTNISNFECKWCVYGDHFSILPSFLYFTFLIIKGCKA